MMNNVYFSVTVNTISDMYRKMSLAEVEKRSKLYRELANKNEQRNQDQDQQPSD